MSGLVVVGADGSVASLAAVEAAAREAQGRDAGLRVVHAFVRPALHVPLARPRWVRRRAVCGTWPTGS